MKKQILTLTFFTLALIFAGMNTYAQYVDTPYLDNAPASCPTPTALNCGTPSALTPAPGETYTYDIQVTAGSKIQWFVTTDVNVIGTGGALTTNIENVGGAIVLNAGTAVGGTATYNDPTNTADVLAVQWNYFAPGTTVLLVAYAIDAAGCTDNVEVYRIQPVFNFTLDIAALEDDGTIQDPAAVKECVSPVQSATYDGTNLVMDYGDNYIYYIVTAANWVTSWQPSFTGPTYAGLSTVGTVEWAYSDQATGAASVWHPATDAVEASHYGAGVTSIGTSGACIVLRVNVDHSNANEMIAAETVTVGVDGLMYNAATSSHDLADRDDDGSGGCIDTVTDEADFIISPRPDINAETPAPFVPKN